MRLSRHLARAAVLLLISGAALHAAPPATAADDAWSPQVDVDRMRGMVVDHQFAVNADGAAVMVWRCLREGDYERQDVCARVRGSDGDWSPRRRVAGSDEVARGWVTPATVIDNAGVATLTWVAPSGRLIARRLQADGTGGATVRLTRGLPPLSHRLRTAINDRGDVLAVWNRGDDRQRLGWQVLSAEGSPGRARDRRLGRLVEIEVTGAGFALLTRRAGPPRHTVRVTRLAADGRGGTPTTVARGRADDLRDDRMDLAVAPDGSLDFARARRRAGSFLTRRVSGDGEAGPVARVATGLTRPGQVTVGYTDSGRLLAVFRTGKVGANHWWGLRLPTGDDQGTDPVRLGDGLGYATALVAGEHVHLTSMVERGEASAWTWDGAGALSEPTVVFTSPIEVDDVVGMEFHLVAAGHRVALSGLWYTNRWEANTRSALRVAFREAQD